MVGRGVGFAVGLADVTLKGTAATVAAVLGEVVLGKVFAVGIPVDTEDTAVGLLVEAVVGLPVESSTTPAKCLTKPF